MAGPSWIGKRLKRFEDPKLIQGQGTFLADLPLDNPLHMKVVRSTEAHARISGLELAKASALPGVKAVLSAADLADLPDLPGGVPKGGKAVDHPPLAKDVVHYVGDPVILILAETVAAAEDAADLVSLSYDSLEPVMDVLDAAEDKALVHPSLETNIAYRELTTHGEPRAAFQEAAHIMKARIKNQRVAPMPMETRGCAAAWDGTRNAITVWSSTQSPHDLRDALADCLNLDKTKIRVITPDVGGGFGAKLQVYPEDLLVAKLSQTYSRPVKWVESRTENLMSMIHGRDQIGDLEVACDNEGRVLGIRGRIVADLGAYLLRFSTEIPTLTMLMIQGPYTIRNFEIDTLQVYTTKTPTSAYRGAGRPEATFYLERLMDLIAKELDLDPAEVRRRNFIPPEAFPYKAVSDIVYDSGEYEKALDLLLEKANYTQLRKEQEEARAEGRFVGIGLSTYVEICAFGWEMAKVRVNADGTATVFTGTSPHGQGAATGFAQIVAEKTGIPPERVQVVHGDTLAVPSGGGTGGSRTLVVGGSAIMRASDKVREKMLAIAAHMLEASAEDLELSDNTIQVRGVPSKPLSIAKVAAAAYNPGKLPEGLEPGLEESGSYNAADSTYPFGAHFCMVELDPDTGKVTILKYVSVDDCGTVMNPLLVEGQVHGGIAQAIGQALYEGVTFDAYGQNQTSSLMDYALPKARDLLEFELHRTITPSPTNPIGAKGVGEAGTIGGTPAVANAVIDALAPFGITHLDMPFQSRKVWQAMQ